MGSPPKPWERAQPPSSPSLSTLAGGSGGLAPSALTVGPVSQRMLPSTSGTASPMSNTTTAQTGAGSPNVPNRPPLPSSLSSTSYGPSSSYGGYGNYDSYSGGYNRYSSYSSPYSSSPYSSPYSSYGSPYSRFGSSYSSPYSYGGYGGGMGYGGYGGYGGGYRPFGGGMMGGPGVPPGSMLQQVEQGSQTTFAVLDQIVQAFGGFAQMLESTFFATHSSFMAMMGVIEQFSVLRDYFGRAFAAISLVRFLKSLYYRLTGKAPPVSTSEINPSAFEQYESTPPFSKKPLLLFLLFFVGLPYLLSVLLRGARRSQGTTEEIDPSTQKPYPKARALYDFVGQNAMELSFRQGDQIIVLSTTDPQGRPSEWWKGKLASAPPNAPPHLANRVGLFPGNHVELLNQSTGEGNLVSDFEASEGKSL